MKRFILHYVIPTYMLHLTHMSIFQLHITYRYFQVSTQCNLKSKPTKLLYYTYYKYHANVLKLI